MKKHGKYLGGLALLLALVACGGGGGTGAGEDVAGGGGPVPDLGPAWGEARFLEGRDFPVSQVDVSINANGVGSAIWLRKIGAVQNLLVSRYFDGKWEDALALPDDGGVDLQEPQIAVLSNGEALAIWKKTEQQGIVGVYFSQTAQGKWQPSRLLQESKGEVKSLELVAGSGANAVAVWSREGAAPNANARVFASHFRSNAFQSEATLVNEGDGRADLPDVAIDAAGNTLVAWRQQDANDGVSRVFVRHYVSGEWKDAALVSDAENDLSVDESGPDVAIGTTGVASVVWGGIDSSGGSNNNVQMNTSTSFTGGVWEGAKLIASNGPHFRPTVTFDGQGVSTVVFLSRSGNGDTFSLNAYRHLSTGSQSASRSLDSLVKSFRVGADAEGRLVAVWGEKGPGGRFDMFASHLEPSNDQWTLPELLENDHQGSAHAVALAVNANGRALAAWLQETANSQGELVDSIAANIFK